MCAKINKKQTRELWQQKISHLTYRQRRTFAENYLFPALTLFLSVASSKFDLKTTSFSISAFALYTIMAGIFQVKYGDEKKLLKQGRQYALFVLLKSINDLGYLTIIFMSIWVGSIYNFERTTSSSSAEKTGFVFLCIIFAASLFSSSIALRWKTKNKREIDNKMNNKTIIWVAAILSFGLIVNLIPVNLLKYNSTSLFAIVFAYLGIFIFLPNFVWSIYEILFLGLRKWPEIYYKDSQVVVEYKQ